MPKKSKKKKSKAAIEAELKEKEEEEERLRMEEEEKEKLRLLKKEENEKQEQIRKQLQREQFQKDEDEMCEIKMKRQDLFCQEMKIIQDEQEWREYLLCNDHSVTKIHDVVNLNCFLYEHRIEPGAIIAAEDICKFCDDVGAFMTGLSADDLHEQKTSEDDIKNNMSHDFVSNCLVLLQSKADIVTSQYLKHHHKISTHEKLLSVQGERSSFDLRLYNAGNQTVDSSTKVVMQNAIIELPPPYLSKSGVIVRFMRIPFHKNQGLHRDSPLIIGDTYQISVRHLPIPANRVGHWSVKLDDTCSLKILNFHEEIRCCIDIPKFIVESNSLTLLRQDDDCKGWSNEGISDISFDFDKRRVSFNLSEAESTIAIALSKNIDLSYRSWSIGPVKTIALDTSIPNENRVEFSVETPRFCVRIQVIKMSCYLIEPQLSQLSDLLRKPHTPEHLLLKLSQRGIHLLPSKLEISALQNSSMNKNRLIEERFCEDLSLLCCSFDATSNLNNKDLDSSRVIYNIKESDTFTGYSNIFPNHQILMTLFDNNENLVSNEEKKKPHICNANGRVCCSLTADIDNLSVASDTHLYSIFTMKTLCSPEAYNRVEMSSPCTSNTMRRLLWLVNPINFTDTKF